jgi:hypothetical protein
LPKPGAPSVVPAFPDTPAPAVMVRTWRPFRRLRRKATALVPGLTTGRHKTAPVKVWDDEIQNLQPGEWVEVKSRDEILSTLDKNAKHRGLRFVPEMYDFCGRQFRVFKRVKKICIENTPAVRRITNPVLLEGESVRGAASAATEPASISGAKYGLRRRSTKRAPPKHYILSHVRVFIARQNTTHSPISLNDGLIAWSRGFAPRRCVISSR